MKKRSVEVLDTVDEFEDKLNWVLFKAEQDARLWAPKQKKQWYPGKPMYKRPKYENGNGEQYIRPMFEVLLDSVRSNSGVWNESQMMCLDCEVLWPRAYRRVEEPCWVCGQSGLKWSQRVPLSRFRELLGIEENEEEEETEVTEPRGIILDHYEDYVETSLVLGGHSPSIVILDEVQSMVDVETTENGEVWGWSRVLGPDGHYICSVYRQLDGPIPSILDINPT